jgi:hypothetical protein
MDYSSNLSDMEISWIIDAIVSGRATRQLLEGINESELEKILILINQRIKMIQEESKPEFPEQWGVSSEVFRFEAAMGLPRMKYFSKPMIDVKYF